MIPYGRQQISEEDIAAVVEVLRSDYLTQGPLVRRFEEALAQRVGAAHAVAANSATSALHAACHALGLGPGDHLWTSPNTFVASANCGRYCGAEVDFVDIETETGLLDLAALERKLEQAKAENRLPKVLVPVHFAGQPCDMQAIGELRKTYGFKVLEDAAHAIGAQDKEGAVGSCPHSDITVFSFHPVKIITTAEGGLAVTQSAELAERMREFNSHGVTRVSEKLTRPEEGGWYYEQHALGYNYRMTELQAALGLSQLDRLEGFVQRRNALAQQYTERLADLPVTPLRQRPDTRSAWHLFVVLLEAEASPELRRQAFDRMRAEHIGVHVHYIPVHLQPDYQTLGFRRGDFPAAEAYYARALSLPLHPGLEDAELEQVVEALQRALAS